MSSAGRGALLLTSLLALGAQSCARTPHAAAFVHAPPQHARSFEDRFIRVDYDLMLEQNGDAAGTTDGTWSSDEQRHVTVLATDGDVISKLKVSYDDRQDGPLLGVSDPSPTDGHTYLVSQRGSDLSIRRADGGHVSTAEREIVAREYGDVGKPQPLLVLLAGRHPGDQLELNAQDVRALLGAPPDMDVDGASVSARFVGVRDDERRVAELNVTVHGRLSNGHTMFDLDASGLARVDLKTGWLWSLHLRGKVKARGKLEHGEQWYNVSGKGKIEITRSAQAG
jgi:hypothetical protein